MKKLLFRLVLLVVAITSSIAIAQLYPLFGPTTGILKGNVSSPQTTAAASADVISLWSGTCNSSSYLSGSGACSTPSGSAAGANPTGTVGLTTVNGSATTFLRSDGAPPLSQAITPTWTGSHTWSNNAAPISTTNTSTSTPTVLQMSNSQAGSSVQLQTIPPSASSSTCGGLGSAAAAPCGQLQTASSSQTMPLYMGANGYPGIQISTSSGTVTIKGWGLINGFTDVTPDRGTFTITYTGFTAGVTCTATWDRVGNLVYLNLCAATGTSNATTMTATGLPAEITPAIANGGVVCGSLQDSGAAVGGYFQTAAASSTITFLKTLPGVAFTSSGTKGFGAPGCVITYMLNN